MSGLPAADDRFTNTAHGLAVRAHHGKRAQIVQDIFGCDRLLANAAFGECHILGDPGIEVMANHEHVQMLIECVGRIGPGWVGTRRQHVGQATHTDDIGRMAAARAFSMERVDGSSLERRNGALDKARLVQGVGMEGDLHVERISHRQATVDCSRRRPPVLMQLQAAGASQNHLLECTRLARIAFAKQADVHWHGFGGLQHARQMPGARSARRGQCAMSRPRSSPQHRGHARVQRVLNLLWADEVNMSIDAASRENFALTGNHFSARTDDDVHSRLHVRIACLADLRDQPIANADVRLDDAPVIENDGICDDCIHGALRTRTLRLSHPVADHLAAAELDLFAINTDPVQR